MSTQEPKPVTGEETDNQPKAGEQNASPETSNEQRSAAAGAPAAAAPARSAKQERSAEQDDDDDEGRSGSDMDFGALLDQFEQEQAGVQEGEVVRGTVVDITERGVVIDFGYKSEGIVNQAEFTDEGKLTVKPGDEVEVLIK